MRRNYSKFIDDFLTDTGMNSKELAEIIGMNPETIQALRRGKTTSPQYTTKKKINDFILKFRKGKRDMTTQVSIFEETNDQGQLLQVIYTDNFNGHALDVYGNFENPLFRAGEVAKLIDYSNTSISKFLEMVDDDEKDKKNVLTPGGVQKVWFLTEQGLYEVLFQSRKPKAKEFKSWVKQVLKEIRTQGYYMQGELIEPTPQTEIKAPSTLAEAEQNYINALAQSIIEADSMDQKEDLANKLTVFIKNAQGV